MITNSSSTHTTGTITMRDGKQQFTQAWLPTEPSRATILLQHGVHEHGGRYDHVGRFFAERGYAVHAMDARGHGRSAGDAMGYFERMNTLVEDLHQYSLSLTTDKRLFLVGHSMGGLIALLFAIRYGGELRALVVSGAALDAGDSVPAPAIMIARLLGRVAPHMGIMPIDATTLSKDPAVIQAYDTDPLNKHGRMTARVGVELLNSGLDAKANLEKIILPILIMHGGSDRLVNPNSSRYAFAHVGSADKTLKIYEGLNHEIFNEPERLMVLGEVADWLARFEN